MARRESIILFEENLLSKQESNQTISEQITTPTRKRKRQVILDSSDEDPSGSSKKLSKSQLSKPITTAFLITNPVFNKILMGCKSLKIEKLQDFVVDVCKYWSLKRHAKRGVPLLKRLLVEVFIIYFK